MPGPSKPRYSEPAQYGARRLKKKLPPQDHRPRTRGDCHPDSGTMNARRPCPWVGCRYHLLLDVTPAGRIVSYHLGLEDDLKNMSDTCALDVADADNVARMKTLADDMGMSDKNMSMLTTRAVRKLRAALDDDHER